MAEAHVASLTGQRPTEPHEAFEFLISREMAMLEYYDERIGELTPDRVQGPVVTTRPLKEEKGAESSVARVEEHGAPAAHIWIVLRNQSAERLAKFAKAAIDANVSERRQRVEEAKLDALAGVVNGVMAELTAAGLPDALLRLAGQSFARRVQQLDVINGTSHEVTR